MRGGMNDLSMGKHTSRQGSFIPNFSHFITPRYYLDKLRSNISAPYCGPIRFNISCTSRNVGLIGQNLPVAYLGKPHSADRNANECGEAQIASMSYDIGQSFRLLITLRFGQSVEIFRIVEMAYGRKRQ